MQASVTQLILLAVAVAVAAIVTIVVIGVVSDEGDNIDKSRNQAAFEACELAGGEFTLNGSVITSAPAAPAANAAPEALGSCDFTP